jgi:CheY-like chemotaxis protein
MKPPFQFILVDDDPTSNLICKLTIEKTYGISNTKAYEKPEAALNYLKTDFDADTATSTTLLLDINMPGMDGWEFMKAFSLLNESIKNNVQVYILSSSTDEADISKAAAIPEVTGYLTKPFLQKSHMQTYTDRRPYFREIAC